MLGLMALVDIMVLQYSARRPGMPLLATLLASNCLGRRLGQRIKSVGVVDRCFGAITRENG